jgi:predicted ArsR family transcriptional regulator
MPNINLRAKNPTIIQEGLKELGESLTVDLADHVNLPHSTVSVVLAELYKRHMVHISGWARNKQGTPIKIYGWGEGDDAKQPLKTSKPKKKIVDEVQLPFPRCDTAASWLTHLVAQT